MFTGLIREIATIQRYENHILTIQSSHQANLGDSIAINGVCLTVIKVHSDGFDLELADETRAMIDERRLQGRVHMEPAMQMQERFEGHIVQGHIDSIGEIVAITPRENGVDYLIRVEREVMGYIVPKGSIAIDGVSLTVNSVYDDAFRLTIIPHTLKHTLIHTYKEGTKVNIETDMFARYIAHILSHKAPPKKHLTWQEIDAMSMGF